MWFDEFIKEAKEINQQLNYLKVACEQLKKDAEHLAQTTTMSNSEALDYVMNKLKENKDMFDVRKIKVGDYVQTTFSQGYVSYVGEDGFSFNYDDKSMYLPYKQMFQTINIKQIGTYKFDEEKVEKKIEKVVPKERTNYGIREISNYALAVKINEIIDYLNKE